MHSHFFSSNSAFQKFLPSPGMFQRNKQLKDQNFFQNDFKTLKEQVPSQKKTHISIESHEIPQEIIKNSDNQQNQKDEMESFAKTLDDHISGQLRKKRKTKKEVVNNEKDQGRGGNCIASNITKTLIRIIKTKFQSPIWKQFLSLIESYKVKSQKENTVIVILILYVFAKQKKIDFSVFENIFEQNFFKNLEESKHNCEKKMEEEPQRRAFHLKNRKMYNKFIDINTKLFEKLSQALQSPQIQILDLQRIEEIISDTYDRKQREVEKAIHKIKSIILNHSQLKELFGYSEHNVIQTYQQAVSYAYRRNLPKRYKYTLAKIQTFFDEFQKCHQLSSDDEKYLACYFATKIVGQKESQIWQEFIEKLSMSKQFNITSNQLYKMTNYMKVTIPEQIQKIEEIKKRMNSQQTQCKQESLDASLQTIYPFYKTYLEISNKICS